MKKRGFTLIELLAVIVILAIIALIATPIVMNVIENARKGSAERSAENYLKAVESAIATERLDGPVTDGNYEVDENGDLVLQSNNSIKIEVDVNGTLPEKGTIVIIVNGLVDKTQIIIVVGDYTVTDSNNDGKLEATKGNAGTDTSYICEKTGEASKTVGAQYTCHLDTDRTFYVLENIESSENISLIMDRNFTDEVVPSTLAWCIDGGNNNATCKNINSKKENPLKHIQDTFGNNVTVSFPTKDQIVSANNGGETNLPQWLYDYLQETPNSVSGVSGYWAASPRTDDTRAASFVWFIGVVNYNNVDDSSYEGVRPVITISKEELD